MAAHFSPGGPFLATKSGPPGPLLGRTGFAGTVQGKNINVIHIRGVSSIIFIRGEPSTAHAAIVDAHNSATSIVRSLIQQLGISTV